MMSNLDKSEELIRKHLEKRLNKTDRVIAKQYARLLKDMRNELIKYYEKYEQGGILTYAEMAKFERLNKFKKYIIDLLAGSYKELRKTLHEVLEETYLDGYYLTAWAVETDTLSKLAYSAVAPNTITAMIENPISGLTLTERLQKNRSVVIYTVQQELVQGLVQGESYGTMANRIKTVLGNDTAKAMRVARTEAHRVMESSKLDSAVHANKNGVIMTKEWNNRSDERSRPTHKEADGQKVPVDKDFKIGSAVGPAPGQLSGGAKENVNCGCFVTYSIETVKKPDAKDLDGMVFDTWMNERAKV